MKRFVSRHLSIGGHRFNYTPLSSSDSQLDDNKNVRVRDAELCSTDKDDEDTEEVKPQRDGGHRKRWFHVKRRKKRREGDTSEGKDKTQVVVSTAPSRCDELEIAVEASHVSDTYPGDLYRHHEGTLECCTSNDARRIGIQSLDLATAQHTRELSMRRRPERRFAICEELEREMVMANGMNLRKSRKNLVIRQVLHDLLLL